ncbi:hypothetical protein EW146_g9090 [Bondarzewia mesenterica]|uniref:Uncharacterized protein n=1 Tax=Bondarzewia mesenterica TaxID=1095465 RepID=A0A4S4LB41_9AGAM|nr:hypothetical protein EW146_g9090 [Bondarzewia mesenterica]
MSTNTSASQNKSQSQGSSDAPQSEQQFTTQPHPAKTNDPADLLPQPGGGLTSKPEFEVFRTPGPVIPDADMLKSLEQPQSHDALQARAAELNAGKK